MEGRKEGVGGDLPSFGRHTSPGPYMEELSHSMGVTSPTPAASLHNPLSFSSWTQCADTASYASGGFTGWNSFQPTLDLMGHSGSLSQPMVDLVGNTGSLSQPVMDVLGNTGSLSQPLVDVGTTGTQSPTNISMYDDYKSSLSQPESNSDNGSEGGGHYPANFTAGLEALLSGPSLAGPADPGLEALLSGSSLAGPADAGLEALLSGSSLSLPTEAGRNLYADALAQMASYKPYEPFGTTDVFHGVESPVQESSSSPSLQNASSRPSYCEVARNNPAGAPPMVGSAKPKPTLSPSLKDGARFPDFPAAFGPPKVPFRRHKSSRSYISKPKSPNLSADMVPPILVEPDSKMGLDDFGEPSIKVKDRGRRSFGGESGSNPQSRKGSTSSIGSGSSGLEEIAYLWPPPGGASAAQLRDGSPPADLRQGSQVTTAFPASTPGRESKLDDLPHEYADTSSCFAASPPCAAARVTTAPTPMLTVPLGNKKQTSSSAAHVKPRCDDISKKKPFFDPKRIFETKSPATSSGKAGFFPSQSSPSPSSYPSLDHTQDNQAATESNIPNNQQKGSQPEDQHSLLNNGKPKSNLYPSGTVHGKPPTPHYINNDLRQPPKKQTNTEGRNSPNRSQDKSTNTPSESSHTESPADGNSQPLGEPRLQAASTGRRKPDSTGRKSAAELKQQYTKRSRRHKDTTGNALGELLLHSWDWCKWLLLELMHYTLSISVLALKVGLALLIFLLSCAITLAGKLWVTVRGKLPFLQFWSKGGAADASPQTRVKSVGLEKNIELPTTGEEAMKRLLSCKGKDPYSILGVRCDATDEEIKRYYRKQAVLVHPDKNQQPGAEEAFKILGHSFEIIGELEKRNRYDAQRMETRETETAMQEFADLLTKLHDKMQEAANLMRCDNCGGKHRRVPTERPFYNARFCDRCNTRHSAKEGDVWAESTMMGFLWHYFACMEGKIYDITEWASCQCGNFKHIQANAHHVIYRIATQGNSRQRQQQGSGRGEADLEDFINHLFSRTTRSDATPGETAQAAASAGGATSGASTKKRRRKKKH